MWFLLDYSAPLLQLLQFELSSAAYAKRAEITPDLVCDVQDKYFDLWVVVALGQ